MLHEEVAKNYHSYIDQIKDHFDPIILKMRNQRNESWIGIAWKGPLKQFTGHLKQLKILAAVKWATLPVIGSFAVAGVAWFKQLPVWLIILSGLVILIGSYCLYVVSYIGKMATIGHPDFHVEALKAKRPDEYKLWQHFIQKDDFTFNGLYNFLNSLLVPRSDHSIASVLQYSMGREEALEATIEDLRETIEDYKRTIEGLIIDIEKSDSAIDYLVNLIASINTNLYRLTNDVLEFGDLRLVTPFTIYALKKDDTLRKIYDVGTSGGSPEVIHTWVPRDPEYAAVTAIKSGTDEAYVNNPYPGRYVVAFTMRMLQDEKWVWCFHFDESDERALSLILSNDIIEARQIRRLIHGFCLILHKRMISKKEAAQDDAEKAN